jgi:hypothetical protein
LGKEAHVAWLSIACSSRFRARTAIVGHDRVGEFLIVRFIVWFLTIQGFDLPDCLTSEHLSVPRDAKLTRPVNVRHPTIERADKLAQR